MHGQDFDIPADTGHQKGNNIVNGKWNQQQRKAEHKHFSFPTPKASAFGLRLEARATTSGEAHNTAGERLGQLQVSGIILGGEPLLTLGGQAPIASLARYGEGLVVATAFARPFSDRVMGTTAVIPNQQQRFLFETEFWLLRSLLSGDFPPLRLPIAADP